jgi:hypothetical protein
MANPASHVKRILLIVVAVLLVLAGILGFGVWYYLFREKEQAFASDEDHFKYASIGTENQDGIPYWIWLVLPRVFPDKLPGPGGYTSLGLTWEQGKEMPVGFTKKTVGFQRVGLTCAACTAPLTVPIRGKSR